MPSADDSTSTKPSSGSSSRADQLAYYKTQYEQLESELSDFQASSRELETELEREIEASEKRERKLKEKVDTLRYEVDEWKAKCKQSKTEGNAAQNTLQKEITFLRDANRTLQLKLRDVEVVNDDYERQARNTTSSLEDLESKYNVAIERGVLLEEEMRSGEQERETLRIQTQRLRDELSDMKIETEIVQDRLRNAEWELHGGRRRKPSPLYHSPSTPQTPDVFDRSPDASVVSSPLFTTPPAKSSLASLTATPPSPPMSEASVSLRKSMHATPGFPRQRASAYVELGSRSLYGPRAKHAHNRASSVATYSHQNGRSTSSVSSRPSIPKFNLSGNSSTYNYTLTASQSSQIPKSGSLYQIRGLIGKMQKLEERVQSAKSKLPPPSETASRASSRAGSVMGDHSPLAGTITARRDSRKRLSGSSFSSSAREGDPLPAYVPSGRQSFGTRTLDSRPSSRTSFSSSLSHSTHPSVAASTTPSNRPDSRQSRTRTPLGHYSTNPTTESRRPPSSLSNPGAPPTTTPVQSKGTMSHIEEDEELARQMSVRAKIGGPRRMSSTTSAPTATVTTPTPGNGIKKRTASGMSAIPTPRSFRASSGIPGPERRGGAMGPPPARKPPTPADLGETF